MQCDMPEKAYTEVNRLPIGPARRSRNKEIAETRCSCMRDREKVWDQQLLKGLNGCSKGRSNSLKHEQLHGWESPSAGGVAGEVKEQLLGA